jgi:acetyl/propionyl-CoA carboxylase alpha subunit
LTTYKEPTSIETLGTEEGIRVDSGITEGSEISVHYDPMSKFMILDWETETETETGMRMRMETEM